MKSIRGQFLRLNLGSILLCLLLIGGMSLWSISRIQINSSHEILSLTCRENAQELNQLLDDIRNSVDLFCEMADSALPSTGSFGDMDFAEAYVRNVELVMGQIARVTEGVCAYYYRPAPELTNGVPLGFFYSVEPDREGLHKHTLTDLSVFDPADTEHVGWYYQPQQAGHAIWMEPYYNKNIGIYMVSYVVPLYRDGLFWGIAGMDVDFDVVIARVKEISPYQTGYACLLSDTGQIYYHPELEIGSNAVDTCPELQPMVETLARHDSRETEKIFSYQYCGVDKVLTFSPLRNGMELLLAVQRSEIRAPLFYLLGRVALITLGICLAVVLVIIPISNRISRPLEQLTRAAEEAARGNLDAELPPAGNDEVGSLTRSFEVTLSSLRQYVANISSMAYSDPLTHVKNKAAYDKELLRLREEMEKGQARFGMLMLDVNNLKRINDRYGHERGDEYLVNNCRFICETFKHSPVFRIGGDEFMVLLTGEDLADRSALLAQMDRRIAECRGRGVPWERLNVAKGLGVCREEDRNPEEVFQRADKAMYADKRRMKDEEKLAGREAENELLSFEPVSHPT